MNCEEIKNQLSDYIDGELSQEAAAVVAAHIEACAGCSQAYEEMTQLVGLMRDMDTVDEPADLVQNVRSRLAKKPSLWERARELFSTPALRVPAAATALAAILLLVLYVPTHRDQIPLPGFAPEKRAVTDTDVDLTLELDEDTPEKSEAFERPKRDSEVTDSETEALDEIAVTSDKKRAVAGREEGATPEPKDAGAAATVPKGATLGRGRVQDAPAPAEIQPEVEAPASKPADENVAGVFGAEEALGDVMTTTSRDDKMATVAVDSMRVAAAVDSAGGKVVEWVYDEQQRLSSAVAEIPVEHYDTFLEMLKEQGRVTEVVLSQEAMKKEATATSTMASKVRPSDETIKVRVHIRR